MPSDAQPAPDARADAATLALCRRLAEAVEASIPGTLDDSDPEFLHDLRVGVRRSRTLLREMKGVLPPGERERARQDLRWIQTITGPTRDLDVHLIDLGPEADAIRDAVARRRTEAARRMHRELRGARFARVWLAWRVLLARGLPDEPDAERPDAALPVAKVAGRRIRRVYERMVAEGGAIDDDSPAEALHDLRKRGKELRYLLELFGPLWPKDRVKPMVRALKELQDVLGRFQDKAVQAEFLHELAPDLDDREALVPIILRLRAEQAAQRAEFAERFEAFASKKNRRLVNKTFRML